MHSMCNSRTAGSNGMIFGGHVEHINMNTLSKDEHCRMTRTEVMGDPISCFESNKLRRECREASSAHISADDCTRTLGAIELKFEMRVDVVLAYTIAKYEQD